MNSDNLIRRYIIVGERQLSNYWWATVILLGAIGFLYTGLSSYGQFKFSQQVVTPLVDKRDLPLTEHTQSLESISASPAPALQEESVLPSASDKGEESSKKSNDSAMLTTIPVQGLENASKISFFPQGLLMCFYGSLGFLLSLYWWLLIWWNVGGGFNEFNKKDGFVRIFRWGYPGKNRRIDLYYNFAQIDAIRVEFKQGFDSSSVGGTIYLKLKSKSNNKTERNQIPLTGMGQVLTLKEIEKQASELANFLQVCLEGI